MYISVNLKQIMKAVKRELKPFAFTCAMSLILGALGINIVERIDERIMATSAEGSWGLSFQRDGEIPIANASQDFLAKYNAFFIGDTSEKNIYLTFDAGFENGNTEKILDALKKHNAPACFFLVGNYLETNPELVNRMVEEGHIVGNHTMHHPDMAAIGTKEAFTEELTALEELYKDVTGQDMLKIYRPPQGRYSQSNLEMAKELGYTTVFWSLAYVDWYENQQPTKEEAFNKLLPRIHDGAIVLLHSTSKTNGEIMDDLLSKWEEQGYTFRPITELTLSSRNSPTSASGEMN